MAIHGQSRERLGLYQFLVVISYLGNPGLVCRSVQSRPVSLSKRQLAPRQIIFSQQLGPFPGLPNFFFTEIKFSGNFEKNPRKLLQVFRTFLSVSIISEQ